MRKYTFILLFFFTIKCISADIYYVNNDNDRINLKDYLYYFEDKSQNLNLNEIKSVHFREINYKTSKINFGRSKSIFWFKFSVKSSIKYPLNYILSIENPRIDEVDFYEFRNGTLNSQSKLGESRNFENREIKNRNHLFKSKLSSNDVFTYYIRVNNNGNNLAIPIVFKNTELYFTQNQKQLFFIGLYFGLFLMIFFFTLYFFIRFREKTYLFYLLYIFFSTCFILGIDGLLAFVLPDFISFKINAFLLHISTITLLFFIQEFYSTKKQKEYNVNLFFKALLSLSIIGTLLAFLPYPIRLFSINIGTITAPVIFTLVFTYSIILYKKEKYKLLFSLAFLFSLISAISFILYEYGFLFNSVSSILFFKTGRVLEGILLTLAVIERFKFINNEANASINKRNYKIEIQKDTLQEINDNLEKMFLVTQKTYNNIAIYDTDGNLEWANDKFIKQYNIPKYFSINNIKENKINIRSIFENQKIEELITTCLFLKESVIFERNVSENIDKEKWVQTTLSPYLNENEKPVKIVTIDSDITNLKKYETDLIEAKERADQSDRLKTAFLTNISHEIRTPLNAIIGFLKLIFSDEKTAKQKVQYQTIIRNSSDQLIKIIDNLLNISKIESGDIKIKSSEGHLNKTIKDLYKKYNLKYIKTGERKNKIIFSFNNGLSDDYSNMKIDFGKLVQVLHNLLDNAFKFTEEGFIELGYDLKDNKIIFFVKDSGIGIPNEKKEMIFYQFNQIEIGLSQKYSGVGLGLSIASGFVKKMNGEIWVESKPDKGSEFYFSVPYIPVSGKKIEKLDFNVDTINWKGKTILVVEDIYSSFVYLEEILKPTYARILHAKNGKEGIEIAQNNTIDLVLMDLRLPDMTGYEVTKIIKEMKPLLPIIAQTANTTQNEYDESMNAGCCAFLSKPFDDLIMLKTISKWI